MNITIIGTGFVGVVSAAVFASLGNQVIGLDVDEKKISSLEAGKVPFFEPGLEELLLKEQAEGRLAFTTDYKEAISASEIVIIAVGTPSDENGHADLTYLNSALDSLAPHLKNETVVVVKSTVPPGTLRQVHARLEKATSTTFYLASLPEFLKEGTAVEDTLHPDRVVIGATDEVAFQKLFALHEPLKAPIVKVSPESAQMGKYAANAYLATRITFINQIADLCQHNGADIEDVIKIIGYDKRIGSHYWYPGLGYGGSCFPKDVNELAAYSREVGEDNNLFVKINELNKARIPKLMTLFEKEVGGWQGKKVAVLGLAFKPQTNDMREAPSVKVIPWLLEKGAHVVGYDPQAIAAAEYFIEPHPELEYQEDLATTLADADVVLALIEWSEIINFDFSSVSVKNPTWFIDTRNQFDRSELEAAGYTYRGMSHE